MACWNVIKHKYKSKEMNEKHHRIQPSYKSRKNSDEGNKKQENSTENRNFHIYKIKEENYSSPPLTIIST